MLSGSSTFLPHGPSRGKDKGDEQVIEAQGWQDREGHKVTPLRV